MVSNNPNPPERFYLDPSGMPALPGLNPFSTSSTSASTTSTSDDPSKKIRKPYTITKSRESWTDPEHDKFLEALHLFDRDWKKIEAFVGSKSVIQIRSHAQKYFLKVQKNGSGEHLPPPRPKRKATHPYPQKASKNAPETPQVSGSAQSSSTLLKPGHIIRPDPSSMLPEPINSASSSSWTTNTVGLSHPTKEPSVTNNCCSSSEPIPKTCATVQTIDQKNHGHPLRVLPDFVEVYSFIGSVFDPSSSPTGHLQKLKKMDPIDVETVLLLMRNLSINLTSPDFEDHKRLLSSYDIDTVTRDHVGSNIHGNEQSKTVA